MSTLFKGMSSPKNWYEILTVLLSALSLFVLLIGIAKASEPAHLTNPCHDVDGNDPSVLMVGDKHARFVGQETKLDHQQATNIGGSLDLKQIRY